MLTHPSKTSVLMWKFHTMPTPKHSSKDLRVFLTEYRKIKTQLSRVLDFKQSKVVIKPIVVRKLPFQTFKHICNTYVTHDFTLEQMETGLQHVVDTLEQAVLALAEGATVKQVGVYSMSQNQYSKQSKSKAKQRCLYCSGEHLAHECTKYKTVNSRRDRVMQLRLCYNYLTPGILPYCAIVLKLVEHVIHIIIHHCVSKLQRTVLIPLIRILTQTQSVKEKRIHPLLVALTNVM